MVSTHLQKNIRQTGIISPKIEATIQKIICVKPSPRYGLIIHFHSPSLNPPNHQPSIAQHIHPVPKWARCLGAGHRPSVRRHLLHLQTNNTRPAEHGHSRRRPRCLKLFPKHMLQFGNCKKMGTSFFRKVCHELLFCSVSFFLPKLNWAHLHRKDHCAWNRLD